MFFMIAMLAITAACNDVSVEWVSCTYEYPWKVMGMASELSGGREQGRQDLQIYSGILSDEAFQSLCPPGRQGS